MGREGALLISRGFDSGLALWQGARHFNREHWFPTPFKIEEKGKSGTW